jgi:hypothetical protein
MEMSFSSLVLNKTVSLLALSETRSMKRGPKSIGAGCLRNENRENRMATWLGGQAKRTTTVRHGVLEKRDRNAILRRA